MEKFEPVKLAYQEFDPICGTDESLAPVIYLHGVTSTKEVWDEIPQTVANKTKRKAYAVDARNHGDSEYSDVYNFDLNVVDLIHFMNTMKIHKAVLVGHSMGGITACAAALREPERIEMIFSEDMFAKKLPKDISDSCLSYFKLWSEAVETIPSHFDEIEAAKFVVDSIYNKMSQSQTFRGSKENLYQEKVVFRRRADGGYTAKFNKEVLFQALSNPDTLMSQPEGLYNGPAYFIYGSLSPVQLYKEQDNIRKHFPRAELIEYKNATHNVHIEFPEKFVSDLVIRLNKDKL